MRIESDPPWESKYISSFRKHILFLDRKVKDKFYDTHSSEAREILQGYNLDL